MSKIAHDSAAARRTDHAHWDQAVRSLAEIGGSDNVRLMPDLPRLAIHLLTTLANEPKSEAKAFKSTSL